MQRACAILPGFTEIFHIIINGTISKKKKFIECKMCVMFFFTTFVLRFLILRRTELDMIKNVCYCSCKISVTLVGF